MNNTKKLNHKVHKVTLKETQSKKIKYINAMTNKEFKEKNDFRKVEQVFYKCCSMCQHSRVMKNPSKAAKYELLVCTLVDPAFVVEASTVCNKYR